MKNLFYLNLFFVGLPIVLCLLGLIDGAFPFWGLLFTILTGLFQLIAGFKMMKDDPNDKHLQFYFVGVFAFFVAWILNAQVFKHNDYIYYAMVGIAILLALYLTYIIYKRAEHEL